MNGHAKTYFQFMEILNQTGQNFRAKGTIGARKQVTLNKNTLKTIQDIATMKVATPTVTDVLNCAMILLGEQPTTKGPPSWAESLKNQKEFVERLASVDPASISDQTLSNYDKYRGACKDKLDINRVKKASSSLAPLYEWVVDMASAARGTISGGDHAESFQEMRKTFMEASTAGK